MKSFKQISEEVLSEGDDRYPADDMTMSELKIAINAAENILDMLEDGAMIQRWQISAIVKASDELASVCTNMRADFDEEIKDEEEWLNGYDEEDEEPMYVGYEYPSMYGEEVELDEAADGTKRNKELFATGRISKDEFDKRMGYGKYKTKDNSKKLDGPGGLYKNLAKRLGEETDLDEQIKGWKNAGRDIAKWRSAQGKDVKLVSLKKDGTESKMHDASKMFRSEDEAQEHHDRVTKLNPKSKIRHNLYVDGKHVKTLGEEVELDEISYRDSGARNMLKADQKAEREVAKMRAQAAKEAAKKKPVEEEVEQIDEISNDMKKRYLAKAKDDVADRKKTISQANKMKNASRRNFHSHSLWMDVAYKNQDKNDSRKSAMQKAKDSTKKKPVEEETDYKVTVDGLPDMYVKAENPSEVKANLRKVVKNPEMIRGVERVAKATLQKIFRDKAVGKEE